MERITIKVNGSLIAKEVIGEISLNGSYIKTMGESHNDAKVELKELSLDKSMDFMTSVMIDKLIIPNNIILHMDITGDYVVY